MEADKFQKKSNKNLEELSNSSNYSSNDEISSQTENYSNNKSSEKKFFKRAGIVLLASAILFNYGYDKFRPTKQGEIIGGKFSNNTKSELYINSGSSVDTLFFDTYNDSFAIYFGTPDKFLNKAQELESKLKPGHLISVSVYDNNKVHKILNVSSRNIRQAQANAPSSSDFGTYSVFKN